MNSANTPKKMSSRVDELCRWRCCASMSRSENQSQIKKSIIATTMSRKIVKR